MPTLAHYAIALAAVAGAPLQAGAVPNASLSARLAETASGFCVDILSRTVPVPGVASPVYARYGLTEGIPQEAMTALGVAGSALISCATLASGTAGDGAFIVALGGSAGETCRLIVYNAPQNGRFIEQTVSLMSSGRFAWRPGPPPPPVPNMLRLQRIRRDAAGHPFLASIVAPLAPGPVAMTLTVAAIPPNVTLPQGF